MLRLALLLLMFMVVLRRRRRVGEETMIVKALDGAYKIKFGDTFQFVDWVDEPEDFQGERACVVLSREEGVVKLDCGAFADPEECEEGFCDD